MEIVKVNKVELSLLHTDTDTTDAAALQMDQVPRDRAQYHKDSVLAIIVP